MIAFEPWSYGTKTFDCLVELDPAGRVSGTPFHDWLESIQCDRVKEYIGVDGTPILQEPGGPVRPLSDMENRIIAAFLWHVEVFQLRVEEQQAARNGPIVLDGSAVISDSESDSNESREEVMLSWLDTDSDEASDSDEDNKEDVLWLSWRNEEGWRPQ